MKPIIESSKPDTTLTEIKLFEKRIGREFPKDYTSFLLENNGGYPIPNRYNFINKKGKEDEEVISVFFGIGEGKYELGWYLTVYQDRMIEYFLPIADNGFGDKYCISLREEDFGHVYIWYHELEVDTGEKPTTENIFKLAENFSNFINSFSENPVIRKSENPKIIEYCIKGNLNGLKLIVEEEGIDINGIYGDGKSNPLKRSLLEFAILYSQTNIVDYLLSLKAKTEGMFSLGGLVNLEIVKLLVANGANINEKNEEGVTALIHSSCFNESYEIAEYLLEIDARIDEENPMWKEGITYAEMLENKKTLQFLKETIGLPKSLFTDNL